jgi:hypothetical protein
MQLYRHFPPPFKHTAASGPHLAEVIRRTTLIIEMTMWLMRESQRIQNTGGFATQQ